MDFFLLPKTSRERRAGKQRMSELHFKISARGSSARLPGDNRRRYRRTERARVNKSRRAMIDKFESKPNRSSPYTWITFSHVYMVYYTHMAANTKLA